MAMIDLSTILTVVVAGSTLLSLRGIRGVCPAAIAFFGVSAAGIAALTRMNTPLLGSSFGVTLIGAAASSGIAVVYVVLLTQRGTALALCQAPRALRSLLAIAVFALFLVGMALLASRGRPRPSLDGCARGPLGNAYEHSLDLQQDGYRVTGVVIGYDDKTHRANTCDLVVAAPSGKDRRAALEAPWGLSGSFDCGAGEAVLCARAGILLVEEEPAAPLTLTTLHGFRLSPSLTPIAPTLAASASAFAPPQEYVWLGGCAALLATISAAAAVRRRRAGAEVLSRHPYRVAERLAEPLAPAAQVGFLSVMPVPAAGVVALVLVTPLAIALCLR